MNHPVHKGRHRVRRAGVRRARAMPANPRALEAGPPGCARPRMELSLRVGMVAAGTSIQYRLCLRSPRFLRALQGHNLLLRRAGLDRFECEASRASLDPCRHEFLLSRERVRAPAQRREKGVWLSKAWTCFLSCVRSAGCRRSVRNAFSSVEFLPLNHFGLALFSAKAIYLPRPSLIRSTSSSLWRRINTRFRV